MGGTGHSATAPVPTEMWHSGHEGNPKPWTEKLTCEPRAWIPKRLSAAPPSALAFAALSVCHLGTSSDSTVQVQQIPYLRDVSMKRIRTKNRQVLPRQAREQDLFWDVSRTAWKHTVFAQKLTSWGKPCKAHQETLNRSCSTNQFWGDGTGLWVLCQGFGFCLLPLQPVIDSQTCCQVPHSWPSTSRSRGCYCKADWPNLKSYSF